MKTLVIFTFIILVCTLFNSDAFNVHKLLRTCCPNVTRTCIPEKTMTSVTKTECAVNAILVKTQKGRLFCIDGNWDWAKNLLERFNNPVVGTVWMPLNNRLCKQNISKAKKPAAFNYPKKLSLTV